MFTEAEARIVGLLYVADVRVQVCGLVLCGRSTSLGNGVVCRVDVRLRRVVVVALVVNLSDAIVVRFYHARDQL